MLGITALVNRKPAGSKSLQAIYARPLSAFRSSRVRHILKQSRNLTKALLERDLRNLKRRNFLQSLAIFSAATALSGCQQGNREAIDIQVLKKSVPAALISEFRKEVRRGSLVQFDTVSQRQESFDLLQKWQRNALDRVVNSEAEPSRWFLTDLLSGRQPERVPHLCQLGHYWLDRAIALKTIAPLSHLDVSWPEIAAKTPFRWQYRPTAEPNSPEPLWAVPYTWGTTAIAYRADRLGDWRPQDWQDLWEHPDLEGRIILPDSPRETIGLALKSLGESYNTPRPDRVSGLRAHLEALQKRTLTYSSTSYQQSLVLGDAWVAIGTSQDIAKMPEFGRTVGAVVPRSGTALWADLWVQPRVSAEAMAAAQTGLTQRWIEFCW